MAVSGTTTFTLTRDEILDSSARVTGYLAAGEVLSAEDKTNRSQALNIMVKNWARKGLALWVTDTVEIPLVAGDYDYTIGPSGSDITADRPLRILDSSFVRDPDGNDIQLRQLARSDYNIRSPKGQAGVPVDFYYDPGRDYGTLYLLNVPATSGYTFHAQTQRQFFDMVAGSDNFDFPAEWLLPLKWGLAAEMGLEDGVELDKLDYIERKSQAHLEACFDFSVEEASTYFTVDTQGMR